MNVLDQFSLAGKVAVVTGASSGIGKRVALGYAQAGAKVAVAARGAEKLADVARELRAVTAATILDVPCDVTRPESVAAMVETVCSRLGGVDVAVCNAGIVTLNGLDEMPLEEFESVQKTNVSGVFLTAQACARAMIRQGRGGSIVVTASMSGHVVNTPQKIGHYCASKAAVIQLAKAMAVEFAPHGIRVNSVSPGYIMTELVEPLTGYHAAWTPRIPLGRLGKPEELMGLYVYLASDASGYMTGSDVVIDGGYTCL
jgi:NAD(P)-dependent dehydrogenase (short-subunit alcohol dehydrogenase family)